VTTAVVTKNKHVFDVRSEIAIRDIKAKRTNRTILCLKCKKQVSDPSSSCSAPEKSNGK
jgi:hypothetical protein